MRYWIAIIGLLVICCSEDQPIVDFVPVYDVPEAYQREVDKFIEEAAARGIDLTIDNLIIVDDPTLDVDLCGSCSSSDRRNDLQKTVRINARHCWDNPQMKETLLFHELGHCILGRSHMADTLPNGDPKSLMVASNLTVYSPCVYVFGDSTDHCNFVFKRAYYLDELFEPNTPVPPWAK